MPLVIRGKVDGFYESPPAFGHLPLKSRGGKSGRHNKAPLVLQGELPAKPAEGINPGSGFRRAFFHWRRNYCSSIFFALPSRPM